ncbi:hypothetical protein J0X19_03840 [Hymenobacter sp. BT186]|uniref:Uncharacterized protein n=1 Tax=Hymenobacter telluris TaxID=2816474 RepID=A0A939EV55_9BACT|nr:hypothetical protein [Hymenobacter telluris]MBO0357067.1 hypothetical protein [Hymenobacter telluris]MBW3373094.1 hypothetical protein [Hymenobacter norwichensis]
MLTSGDTLRGEIENAFWKDAPATVRFRPGPTVRPTPYPARRLQSVYLASGRLLRHELLPVDRYAETRYSFLDYGNVRQQKPDSVLADVLLLGSASLRGASLEETEHYWVQRTGQPHLELSARKYLGMVNGVQSIIDGNDYQSQLLVYFGDCEAVVNLIPTTPFTTEALQHLVHTYNQQCSGQAHTEQVIRSATPQRGTVAVRIGVLGGVRYNSLRFRAADNTNGALDGVNADNFPHPQGGLYVDVVNSGRRLAFHTAVLATTFGRMNPVRLSSGTSQAGSFAWRGTQAFLQFGLRGFLPVGTTYQVVVGGGYELNAFWLQASHLSYPGRQQYFLDRFYGTPLPYLEAGIKHNRLLLALNGRVYMNDTYFYYNGTEDSHYTYQPWSLSLMVGYRLNADSDATPGR